MVGRSLEQLWTAHAGVVSAAEAVYQTLREAILTGALQPGEPLGEEQLARAFQVSRTPVREGILRLESEELAHRIPRRGLVVRTITEHEVLEVYAVRMALDGLAARLAAVESLPADRAHLSWLNARFAEATAGGDVDALIQTNIAFHEALCQAAHNSLLLRFTTQIHDWVRRVGQTTLAHPNRAATAVSEHEAILAAIATGDGEKAERLARQHMEYALSTRMVMLGLKPEEAAR